MDGDVVEFVVYVGGFDYREFCKNVEYGYFYNFIFRKVEVGGLFLFFV